MLLGQAEATCADRLSHLNFLFDSTGQGLLVADPDLTVIAANERSDFLLRGLDATSPIGRTLPEVLEHTGHGAEIVAHARNDRPVGPLRLVMPAGVQEVRGASVPGLGFLLVFKDVSDRAAEDEAELKHGSLVREILEYSPIGVNIVGPDGLRLYANRKLRDMLGFGLEEFAATHVSVHYADPSARERLLQEMREEGAVENFESELLRKDGRPLSVLISCRPFRYAGKECVLGWIFEITDRVELERQQLRSREELEIQILELRDREVRMSEQASELETLAVRLAESERKMAELANYDMLTGLPTSRLCQERMKLAMAYAKRNQTLTSVFYVDLDGFKDVNDTFGHDAGDAVLREAAERMKKCFREVDTVARIGGDEFLIVLSGLGFRDAVAPLAERLLNCFSEPFSFPEGRAEIGASIGVAFYNGASDTPETLIKRADKAMYAAKKAGKDRYVIGED